MTMKKKILPLLLASILAAAGCADTKNMDINNYEIVFTDTAKEELEEIYEYISEHLLEVGIANRLMDKIEQSILRLEQNPYFV